MLILVLLLMLPASLRNTDSKASNPSQSDAAVTQDADNSPDQGEEGADGGHQGSRPLASVFCASDYQVEDGWDTPAENLAGILDAAISGMNEGENTEHSLNALIMCGDYTNDRKLHNYELSPEDSISEIRSIAEERMPGIDEEDMIFVQGNHDALTESIAASGLQEYDGYLVYVLNTQNDFPWKQGKTAGALNKVRKSSEALRACLNGLAEKGETRPVIIAGHVPLHFTARTSSEHGTGDNLYSSLIFDPVNEAGEKLDIIYLYGHNHSKGWDCYMGGSTGFLTRGDTILIPEFSENDVTSDSYTERTLNFTYISAGYTGYYMNCGPDAVDNGTWHDYDAADTSLTGTVLDIYADRIVITRWDRNGLHNICGRGEADPYKGGIDRRLIPESAYRTEMPSPQVIKRH